MIFYVQPNYLNDPIEIVSIPENLLSSYEKFLKTINCRLVPAPTFVFHEEGDLDKRTINSKSDF